MKLTKRSASNFLQDVRANGAKHTQNYLTGLIPMLDWLPRYNRGWVYGDLIAGITVATVVVPQSLAYAKLAGVPLEYGLYTSFIGVLVYPFFATSKDVTIGPTAVLSTLTGQLLATYNTNGTNPVVFASALAFLSGLIMLAIGLLRLGIVVDLISVPVVVGFTTGAAIQILVSQTSGLLGISGINTNDPTYLVFVNTLKALDRVKIDAAFGIAAILLLVGFRLASNFGVKRGHAGFIYVRHSSIMIVLVVLTLISWATYHATTPLPIKIVGVVPKGLTYVHVPTTSFLSSLLSPAVSIVLVAIIEQIAMAKAFGRLNGYRADANQEIIAMGITNIVAPFFGAFPATGSLSRSSIKSQSGVKTPLAGAITGVVVLLITYFATPAFYYIPSGALSGIIMVSVADLVARPAVLGQLWDIDFFDFLSFLVAFLATIFVSIEWGIYSSVLFSIIVLLYRIARPQLQLLVRQEEGGWVNHSELERDAKVTGVTPDLTPYPGIAVFRIEEAFTYPNANFLSATIKTWIQTHTAAGPYRSDRPPLWNEARRSELTSAVLKNSDALGKHTSDSHVLKALVFDFSAVNHIDATGLQVLIDARADAERWSGHRVEFFFAHVHPEALPVVTYFLRLPSSVDVVPLGNSSAVDDKELGLVEERTEEQFVSEFVHRSIDDATAAAAAPHQFGNVSSETI